jgi:HD superfamily phosphohydrolase
VKIVQSSGTTIGQLLRAFDQDLPEKIAAIIQGESRPAALAQLVSSQLDVDRMDYLLRDSLMTGVKYGIYDLEWIINALAIDEANDRIYVTARGLYAVEEYLQARYYMFRQVYFHRTLRSAEAVLRSTLKRALDLTSAGNEVWHATGTAFEKILMRQNLSISEHLEIDDADVIFHVKRWQHSEDAVLADLSRRFVDRKLFKALDLDMPAADRDEFIENARNCVRRAGFDPQYYFVEDRASDVPYYNYYTTVGVEPKAHIFVEDGYSQPRIREISEVSEVVRGLQKGYELHRVCFPAEVRSEIYPYYHRLVQKGASVSR